VIVGEKREEMKYIIGRRPLLIYGCFTGFKKGVPQFGRHPVFFESREAAEKTLRSLGESKYKIMSGTYLYNLFKAFKQRGVVIEFNRERRRCR
jgi:hypothetical protein